MPHQLAYVSTASPGLGRPELLQLLRQARETNARLGVTGVLLARNDSFLQLLEGDRDRVEALYAAIRRDPRHESVTLIWSVDAAERWFADWSMGFRDLELDPVTEPGLTDVLRGPVEASAFSREVVLQLWALLRLEDTRPGPPPGPTPPEDER